MLSIEHHSAGRISHIAAPNGSPETHSTYTQTSGVVDPNVQPQHVCWRNVLPKQANLLSAWATAPHSHTVNSDMRSSPLIYIATSSVTLARPAVWLPIVSARRSWPRCEQHLALWHCRPTKQPAGYGETQRPKRPARTSGPILQVFALFRWNPHCPFVAALFLAPDIHLIRVARCGR